jgi:hypothetical protein
VLKGYWPGDQRRDEVELLEAWPPPLPWPDPKPPAPLVAFDALPDVAPALVVAVPAPVLALAVPPPVPEPPALAGPEVEALAVP